MDEPCPAKTERPGNKTRRCLGNLEAPGAEPVCERKGGLGLLQNFPHFVKTSRGKWKSTNRSSCQAKREERMDNSFRLVKICFSQKETQTVSKIFPQENLQEKVAF